MLKHLSSLRSYFFQAQGLPLIEGRQTEHLSVPTVFWLCSWIAVTAPFCGQMQFASDRQKENKIWAKLHNPGQMRRLSNLPISFNLFSSLCTSAFLIALWNFILWFPEFDNYSLTVFPPVCLVSLLYGPLFTSTVLLMVIFPWVAVTKHWSEPMSSFAEADPFLPTYIILFAHSEMWKKPVCVVALLKKEGLAYTAINGGQQLTVHNDKRYLTHTWKETQGKLSVSEFHKKASHSFNATEKQ